MNTKVYELLKEGVATLKRIADALEGNCKMSNSPKTEKTCKTLSLYTNKLWTKEEDEILLACRKLGRTKYEMAENLPGRTPAACSTRLSYIRRH